MSRIGSEGRFATRFTRKVEPSSSDITNVESARKVASQLQEARGVVEGQKESIKTLLDFCDHVVSEIDSFQTQSGVRQVTNIPRPTDTVKLSPSLQLGYIKLTIEFLGAGMEHFMEDNINLQEEIKDLKKVVKEIGAFEGSVIALGEIQELDPMTLDTDAPVVETVVPFSADDDDTLIETVTADTNDPLIPLDSSLDNQDQETYEEDVPDTTIEIVRPPTTKRGARYQPKHNKGYK
jgi:chaperonin cofactor prefoldin